MLRTNSFDGLPKDGFDLIALKVTSQGKKQVKFGCFDNFCQTVLYFCIQLLVDDIGLSRNGFD